MTRRTPLFTSPGQKRARECDPRKKKTEDNARPEKGERGRRTKPLQFEKGGLKLETNEKKSRKPFHSEGKKERKKKRLLSSGFRRGGTVPPFV